MNQSVVLLSVLEVEDFSEDAEPEVLDSFFSVVLGEGFLSLAAAFL